MSTEFLGIQIEYERDNLLDDHAVKLLREYYMQPTESSPQEAYARAAVAWSAGDMALAQRLYDAASRKWFMFASPVLSNAPVAGKKVRGLPISCFLTYVPDTVEGLIDHTSELRYLSVFGGGVGGHWSDVRTASDLAPGPMPFLHTVDADMLAWKQGRTRKGSYAAYMDVSHPDIVEFLHMRVPTGDSNRKNLNLHHAINITDDFMMAVLADGEWNLLDPHSKTVKETVRARELWETILETRYRTGEPYLCFIDTANRLLPQPMRDAGLKLNGSNLCVAGETMLLTSDGYRPIHELAGLTVEVWNGREWSSSAVMKTGDNQKLLTVSFSDGSKIDTTPYHKFYVQDGYLSARSRVAANKGSSGKIREVRAVDLRPGDRLMKWDLPVITHGESWTNPYLNGFFSADGTYNNETPIVWLYDQKKTLAEDLMIEDAYIRPADGQENRDGLILPKDGVRAKFDVPVNGDLSTKLEWLAGYLDGDGTVARNGTNQSIQFASVNHEFLRNIRLMLGTLGVQLKIVDGLPKGVRALPDGKGGVKEYLCQETKRGLITSVDVQRLLSLGFRPRRLALITHVPQRDARQFVTVVSVEDNGRVDDTFCFNEPIRHMGVLNGILTGNCIEIFQPTSVDRTAVCCLSSLNAELYPEWKDTTMVADLVTMLDNVLTYFIENAPDVIARARYGAMRERSIGLGVMGYHSLLQRMGVAFESADAIALNKELFGGIHEKAVAQSLVLGALRGEAPDMAGTGRRNSLLVAIAPNANSASLVGASPSIEPWKANAFAMRDRAGTHLKKNRYLEAVLEAHGRNTADVWSDIIVSGGSVQHLDFLTENEKAVFKTGIELDMGWIVRHAAERQPFVCQGQSLNLFFPPNCERGYLNHVHIQAWKSGLKGLYYLRTEAPKKAEVVAKKIERVALKDSDQDSDDPSSASTDECLACHA